MGLTWDDFLLLAATVTNLGNSIAIFILSPEIDIEEKNRRVSAAAKDYLEFLKDLKYVKFMNEVRLSFIKL